MNKSLQWKLLGIIAISIACLWIIWPPFTIKDKDGKVIQKGKINLGLDLQGGMHVVLRVDTAKVPLETRKDAIERAMEIIRNRIDQFGVGEMSIQRQGKDNIIVQLPGVTDRERALEIIGKTAHLEFKLVSDNVEYLKAAIDNKPVDGYELKYLEAEGSGRDPILIAKDASLAGDLLVNAKTEFSSKGFGEPYVSLTLNSKGAQIFANVTATNVGKRLAIVLDGKVVSAPVIREAIPSGQAQISGNFSVEQANDLSVILRAGALPAPVVVEEERTVGPLLGADSIRSGLRATIIGGILVVSFMLFYYRLAGLVANMALILNILLIMACLALFKGTLTLPGIAGLILTIGMSVDANVLIYERIREELKLGKSLRAAIASGYHRALSAIVDSNLTTIVAAALIFKFGTGPIRGFAVTLTIGLIANLFTAVTCGRVVFEVMCDQFGLSKLRFMNIFRRETNFDFIGKRKICYIISLIFIAGSVVLFAMRGDKNYGVDFSGGTLQQYLFENNIKIDAVRKILKDMGYGNASIQQYGNPKEIIIRTQENIATKLSETFREKAKDNPFQVLRVETVGSVVGQNLRINALLSLVLGLAGIAIYVMFRFDIKYGIAGVIALIHDVIVAIGAMALTHRQFDLTIVAALLTIAGYSINDTVVIYDRIRENLRLVKKGSFDEIVNLSVNQMLGRTVLTTGVTMLVVISLLFFGGEVLNNFSFCIFVGFLTGVYSTVYIASPMVISWHRKRIVGPKK
ncbi:MAG: protein translocase subunit SecD [Candidatus Omnitrophota bacterium]|nr:protein translocase subunit SecD [Candidatus Omnitrophota bacterium]